jgi:hypothetical protein
VINRFDVLCVCAQAKRKQAQRQQASLEGLKCFYQ